MQKLRFPKLDYYLDESDLDTVILLRLFDQVTRNGVNGRLPTHTITARSGYSRPASPPDPPR
jgi:hypothetical protein